MTEIKKYYNLSKEVEQKINELLKKINGRYNFHKTDKKTGNYRTYNNPVIKWNPQQNEFLISQKLAIF